MGLLDIKYYCDFRPLEKLQDIFKEKSLENAIYAQYGGASMEVWNGLEEKSNRIQGNDKKYRNRVAVFLELLIPSNIKDCDISKFAQKFLNRLLDECHLPAVCWFDKRGSGRYVQFLISERKYYEEEIKIIENYNKGFRYRSKVTGRMCKATDPEAELISSPGDSKRTYMSKYGKKKRMFAFKKSEFKMFLERVKRIIYEVSEWLNVKLAKGRFLTYIKHKNINTYFSKYVNRNIRMYNEVIRYINAKIDELEYIIFIAPTGFSNDTDLIAQFNTLVHKTRQRLKKKSFTYDKLKVSLSVFCRTDDFKEHIDMFLEDFEESYFQIREMMAM